MTGTQILAESLAPKIPKLPNTLDETVAKLLDTTHDATVLLKMFTYGVEIYSD